MITNPKTLFALVALGVSSMTCALEDAPDLVPEPTEQVSELSAEQIEQMNWAKQIWDSLERQTGHITLDQAHASLEVPDTFYFLNSKDAETVLVDVWGNPPGSQVLGMLFPAELTPFDEDSWAVTVEYEEEGYVSDADAADLDYSELLEQMQDETRESSQQRVDAGYEPIELVGWAATPFYDAQSHKLHWAKELKFGTQEPHTLNYNIRVLGRKGVLVLNFVAGMEQKDTIDKNLDSVLQLAHFEEGNLYSDFDPEIDQMAAYGIGALVAGKVIAKTGFLAVALIFLKKFGVFIVVGLAALGKMLFRKK
jgi:uncharacterized membrane-anchored protein